MAVAFAVRFPSLTSALVLVNTSPDCARRLSAGIPQEILRRTGWPSDRVVGT